ncbi:aldo/keto reductase [Verrucomicrobiaceae bacterium N1E253]|uniref:Aldo/keto reductase n=1 Tax=Oceaniferula marina TaxID=2748318 RepID=A0A851GHT6_9BACT|nr:aldo/keto reductase [Oceaniferula marina]NWK57348.1 aldo/keto reductase [Oceaniferula marina]
MKYHNFENGDRMPVLGLGTWKSAPGEVGQAVQDAVSLGYRHIDCASAYENEEEIGAAFNGMISTGSIPREELWVTSKLWNNAHAEGQVRVALEKTLADLQLDYLDLYLMHWPVSFASDIFFPESGSEVQAPDPASLAATWKGMEDLVDAGLVRHIGVCNFSQKKLAALYASARIKPEMNQIELHPYMQQPEMLSFCQQHGIALTAYSPLGSPDRPEFLKAENEPVLLQDTTIQKIAEVHGVSSAQIMLAWAVNRGTSVIPKSTNPERQAQNLAAADIQLTDEEMNQIAGLDRKRRYVDGAFWCLEGSPFTLQSLWDE